MKLINLYKIIFLFILSFNISANNFEALEKTISDAGGTEFFWREIISPLKGKNKIRNQYFIALQNYYNEKLSRDSFDAIIGQLIAVSQKIPEIKEQLLRENKYAYSSSFSFRSDVKTSGRVLKYGKWEDFFSEWKSTLQNEAVQSRGEAESIFKKIKYEIDSFEASIIQNNRKDRKIKKSNFYKKLKLMPEVKSAASFILLDILKNDDLKDQLNSGDADLILYIFDKLQSKEGLSSWDASLPEIAARFTKDLIPNQKQLIYEYDLFQIKTLTTQNGNVVPVGKVSQKVYYVKSIKRPIHAIWQFAVLGECVGGNCETLDMLTPERWLVPALNNVEVYHLNSTESPYLGFIQKIPMINSQHEKIKIVEFASAEFRKEVLVKLENDHTYRSNIFEQWMFHDPDQAILATSKNLAINNAGSKKTILESSNFALGNDLGESTNWNHLDINLSSQIVENFPPINSVEKYGGNMITDGSIANAGKINSIVKIPFELMKTPDKALEFLNDDNISNKKKSLVTLSLSKSFPTNIEIQIKVASLIKISHGIEKVNYLNAFKYFQIALDPNPSVYGPILQVVIDSRKNPEVAGFFDGIKLLFGGSPFDPRILAQKLAFERINKLRFSSNPPKYLVKELIKVLNDSRVRPHHYGWAQNSLSQLRFPNGFPEDILIEIIHISTENDRFIDLLGKIHYGKKIPNIVYTSIIDNLISLKKSDKLNSSTEKSLNALSHLDLKKSFFVDDKVPVLFIEKFKQFLFISSRFAGPKLWDLAENLEIYKDLSDEEINNIFNLIQKNKSYFAEEVPHLFQIISQISFSNDPPDFYLKRLSHLAIQRWHNYHQSIITAVSNLLSGKNNFDQKSNDQIIDIFLNYLNDRKISNSFKLEVLGLMSQMTFNRNLSNEILIKISQLAGKKNVNKKIRAPLLSILAAQDYKKENFPNRIPSVIKKVLKKGMKEEWADEVLLQSISDAIFKISQHNARNNKFSCIKKILQFY